MLPDSTATDLDQHLSSLVGTPPATQMGHQTLIGTGSQGPITGSNSSNGGLLVTRYNQNPNEYNLHSSQNGPRSLSDSTQSESPVQDDLLTSNTPNLGGNGNQNFSTIGINQNQNSYGNDMKNSYGSNNCNGSIYPVLPASLLYTQLYTAANQTHSFHSHSLQSHSSQNTLMHGELQSVMDIVTQGNTSNNGRQHQQHLMAGNTDLSLISNCGSAARSEENRQINLNGVPRVPQQPGQPPQGGENGNSVWRPY